MGATAAATGKIVAVHRGASQRIDIGDNASKSVVLPLCDATEFVGLGNFISESVVRRKTNAAVGMSDLRGLSPVIIFILGCVAASIHHHHRQIVRCAGRGVHVTVDYPVAKRVQCARLAALRVVGELLDTATAQRVRECLPKIIVGELFVAAVGIIYPRHLMIRIARVGFGGRAEARPSGLGFRRAATFHFCPLSGVDPDELKPLCDTPHRSARSGRSTQQRTTESHRYDSHSSASVVRDRPRRRVSSAAIISVCCQRPI